MNQFGQVSKTRPIFIIPMSDCYCATSWLIINHFLLLRVIKCLNQSTVFYRFQWYHRYTHDARKLWA